MYILNTSLHLEAPMNLYSHIKSVDVLSKPITNTDSLSQFTHEQIVSRLNEIFEGCDDIKSRTVVLKHQPDAVFFFIETALSDSAANEFYISNIISGKYESPASDALSSISDIISAIMAGDGVLVSGNKSYKIQIKGYPSKGVSKSENEKSLRGSAESFADSSKINTALIRKRIRSEKFKVKEIICNNISKSNITICYVDGYARENTINGVISQIKKVSSTIDSFSDSGILAQLIEDDIYSPFPTYQSTERPDNAVEALLRGRVVIFVDNSPEALLAPTLFTSFYKTPDDYYERYLVSFTSRVIRYLATFIAVTMPSLYVSALMYHPEIIPKMLLLSMYDARENVPFSVLTEVIIMELAFELLREAGLRVPGAMGNTIGIVGGLIVGEASVSAGLISPVVVVVVALTAMSSFAIPSIELGNAFRILRIACLVLTYFLGFFGIAIIWLFILTHLCSLKSFGFPYMMCAVSSDIYNNKSDRIMRSPLKKMSKKSIFHRN